MLLKRSTCTKITVPWQVDNSVETLSVILPGIRAFLNLYISTEHSDAINLAWHFCSEHSEVLDEAFLCVTVSSPFIFHSSCVCSTVSWVSCPFPRTVPDALSYASFVPSLKFTQFHCKQLRVFPLWFPQSAVFPFSYVLNRCFRGSAYPLHRIRLLWVVLWDYHVYPPCVPLHSNII